MGVVGEDAFGYFMLEALEDAGIDVSGCRIDPGGPDRRHGAYLSTHGVDRANMTAIGAIASLRRPDMSRASCSPPRATSMSGAPISSRPWRPACPTFSRRLARSG